MFTYESAGRLFDDKAHDMASDVDDEVVVVRGQVSKSF
jgi:hypothetical protein